MNIEIKIYNETCMDYFDVEFEAFNIKNPSNKPSSSEMDVLHKRTIEVMLKSLSLECIDNNYRPKLENG